MKYQVLVVAKAEEDIFDIYRYVLRADGRSRADYVLQKLHEACWRLAAGGVFGACRWSQCIRKTIGKASLPLPPGVEGDRLDLATPRVVRSSGDRRRVPAASAGKGQDDLK